MWMVVLSSHVSKQPKTLPLEMRSIPKNLNNLNLGNGSACLRKASAKEDAYPPSKELCQLIRYRQIRLGRVQSIESLRSTNRLSLRQHLFGERHELDGAYRAAVEYLQQKIGRDEIGGSKAVNGKASGV